MFLLINDPDYFVFCFSMSFCNFSLIWITRKVKWINFQRTLQRIRMQKLRWTCFWTNVNELMKYWRQLEIHSVLKDFRKYGWQIQLLQFSFHHVLAEESSNAGKERDNDNIKVSTFYLFILSSSSILPFCLSSFLSCSIPLLSSDALSSRVSEVLRPSLSVLLSVCVPCLFVYAALCIKLLKSFIKMLSKAAFTAKKACPPIHLNVGSMFKLWRWGPQGMPEKAQWTDVALWRLIT